MGAIRLGKLIASLCEEEVRLVWKDNPLPFYKQAMPAATLVCVAFEHGGNAQFWLVHDLLFQYQRSLSEETYKKVAKRVGLPWWEVKSVPKKDPYGSFFEASQDLALALKARGTRHFFINGRRLPGAQPLENFEALIAEQLAKARELVDSGIDRANVYEHIMRTAKGPPRPEKRTVLAPTKDQPLFSQ